MLKLAKGPSIDESVARRAAELFARHQQETFLSTDALFARLMLCQWIAGILVSVWISPHTWSGVNSQIHLHVWAAIFLGGAISLLPIWATRAWPGAAFTRHSIAVGQMLMSALLIHLTGGRVETHFHVFGSLAILSFYRDWRVLIPATVIVALDHFVRGIYWPFSTYGVLTSSPWRSVEHAGWVVFEDVFLVISCLRGVRDMRAIARRTAEVEASEAQFRTLFEEAPLGMAVLGLNGEFIQANARLCQMTGHADRDLLELRAGDVVHPDDLEKSVPLMEGLLRGELPHCTVEERFRVKGGGVLWTTRTTCIIRDKTGQPQHLLTMVEDTTERRCANEALQESEERFRQFAENIREVFWMTDHSKDQMIYISPAYAEIWGRSSEELYARPRAWLEAIHPDDRERVLHAVITKQEHGGYDEEYRIIRPDGSIRWINDRAFPVRNKSGQVYRVAGTAEDITDRKRADEELRLQKTLLESQSEASIDGILVVSAEGQMLSFNRRFLEMWDVPQGVITSKLDEASLKAAFEKVVDPDAFLAKVSYLYDHPDKESRDEIVLRSGRILDRYSGPVKGADGAYYGRIWSFRDITDEKHAAQALQQAKDEAVRANLAKSEFLSRMSHELRTPLNAILGFGQLLQMAPLPPREADSIGHIVKGGRHLLGLINEVLDIARIEAGRMDFSIESTSVQLLIEETVTLIRPLAEQRNITIELAKLPDSVGDCYAFADLQRTKQVLLNLLSNAIKYNHDAGSVHITYGAARTTKNSDVDTGHCNPSPERVCICVRDSGPGIFANDLLRLFTPFERLGAERRNIEGSGIGLALSKRLIEAMGGVITVESLPGIGSTFCIELPAGTAPVSDPDSGMEIPEVELPGEEAVRGFRQRTVLQIEDNLANRQLMERVLEDRSDVRLLAAMQGQRGLELAREHRPDLVLLDLHLPDLSGAEVLARLRADPATRDIPVVVVSADATDHQVQRLKGMGAQEYLTKPFEVTQLLHTLDTILLEPS